MSQIEQMVQFIRQEAAEKVDEIRTDAEKQFEAQCEELFSKKREEIDRVYERKKKDVVVQQRIKKSGIVSAAHFDSMAARDVKVRSIKSDVLEKLSQVSKNNTYPELIRFLIVQGLLMMMERHVTVKCREEDRAIVQSQLDVALKQFQNLMTSATEEKDASGAVTLAGVTPICELAIDSEFLPAGPKPGDIARDSALVAESSELKHPSCCGGVFLHAKGGKILCDNTLDTRLNLAYEALAPEIRGVLFGVRPPVVYKDVKPAHH